VRKLSHRPQRTLATPAGVIGVGFLTGATVRLRFLPAAPETGVVFVRTDLPGRPHIPARVEHVTDTTRRTTLGTAPAQVGLVEHVLAALSGLRIDNCLVELDAPEPPGMDGSARAFTDAVLSAGAVLQSARKTLWTVDEPVIVRAEHATLAIHPSAAPELRVSYLLDYGMPSPIGWQSHTHTITPEHFIHGLADARTFILEAEVELLRRQGLGARTTAADLIVFGPHGPIDNALRYANEPARHKVLDIVGDLALLGDGLCGHVVAYRSGHPLNVELVRVLRRMASSRPVRRAA
jgi:UDP-3-O-[3-hydroxymyristoyl] N-acetylglucosamine deacetylase